jgi:hypothetical protein
MKPTIESRQHRQSRCQQEGYASALASADRGSENVIVEPIIIAELELGNVEVQVFFANVVDDPALDDRPEAFNRIGVNSTDDVLFRGTVKWWRVDSQP